MQQLFQNIFRREDDLADNKAFLEKIKAEFPYFGPAHFYALKNTDPADPAFEKQAAKTALFFNDAFFLAEQLKKTAPETKTIIAEAAPEPEKIEKIKAPEHASFEDMPLFEPLHATDYFASQGIKLSEEIPADDKLGRQLKSFTSWLKTMKKVHPENIPASAAVEIAVQNLAEKSNLEEEVITEAMAEAYAQQGKQAKAADIYSKLSLLNPSKTAYFAAKIESLKQ